jgi:hypothetical protein
MGTDSIATTEVRSKRGLHTVWVHVTFPDGVYSHKILTYFSQRRAEFAADVIERAANRTVPAGWGMS